MDIVLRGLSDHPSEESSTKKYRQEGHGEGCPSPHAGIASRVEHGCRIGSGVDDIPHAVTFLLANATWIHCLVRSPRCSKRELGAYVESFVTWPLGNVSSLTGAREIASRLSARIIILCSCECRSSIVLGFCRNHLKDQEDGDQGRE